nr:hypothetical protein [Pseudomonadota bacterium]
MSARRALLALALLMSAAACSNAGPASPYARGMAAFEAGDIRTARVEFLNAIQADPDNSAARVMQAQVHLLLGDGVAAEAEIVRARQNGLPVEQSRHLLAHARLLQN